MEGLDPNVVDGGLEGTLDPDVDWKGWKGRRLEGLEGTSIGRVGRDVDWKGWIQTLLMEDWKGRRLEGLDPDVVDGRLEGTPIGRVGSGRRIGRYVGLDQDVVDGRVGRDVGSRHC